MEDQVTVGKVSDSMEKLTKLCNEKATKIAKTMRIENDIEISFWTADIPELICVAKFSKAAGNNVTFSLDFSQSTL